MISANRTYFPSIPLLSRSLYLLKRSTFLLYCILLSLRANIYCNADIVHRAGDTKSDSANSMVFASNANSNQLFNQVLGIQTTINNETSPYCYSSHSGTKEALKRNKWSKYIGNELKIIVYPFCLITKELGNKLGNYFTELACARASGVHFMAVHKQFNSTGAKQGSVFAARSSDKLLIDYLPDIWLNPDPVDPSKVFSHTRTVNFTLSYYIYYIFKIHVGASHLILVIVYLDKTQC